ncbi:MAG: RNA pyrophosphohydrolase [Rickettsiales bacterium]|nr:MAG: RNA pyrophosphohydrolase [Rickettsiales bacterium]
MGNYRKGVGVILTNGKGQFYTFKRVDFPDSWQGVEGGIDEGEDVEKAVYREIQEEIGIQQTDLLYMTQTDWYKYDFPTERDGVKFDGAEKKYFLIKLITKESKLLVNTSAEKEFTEWKLVDKNELIESVPPFKKEVYRQVMDDFEDFI